mmetsp:Transcript_80636/g.159704  ORF Transcript_80636/g.159704 Transcript_80636/m.159704 type:complete len:90 (+) Transcript_80636:842-1111(+)
MRWNRLKTSSDNLDVLGVEVVLASSETLVDFKEDDARTLSFGDGAAREESGSALGIVAERRRAVCGDAGTAFGGNPGSLRSVSASNCSA